MSLEPDPGKNGPPLFTVGHSTRTIPEFVDVLRLGEVDLVVDVRSIPRSRTNPQYNLENLPGALAQFQVRHHRIAELGGLRGRAHDVAPEVNVYWRNRSFHNYADHALSDEFAAGLDELLRLSAERRTAIMCSEAVWWRCHRRIIADYALLRGRRVVHLMSNTRMEPANMTPGAKEQAERLVYPAA
ncbi:DUF488 domain-containing protein [Sphingomonas sp.]|uniref:DUF488 domain-containing protein n=1 Tax=Sphingomonas sp. TaxID=28214 RepID=UPI0017BB6FF5|nr:DUF488 domain-containing protein [Sphingomonas sp.]MBA3510682.1 DUF488 domain-containing protein [Sphingomonas sp.]